MDNTGNAELNYCYNCMRHLAAGQTVCPDCGYDNSVNHNPQDTLPEGAMLAGHYLVGKVLGQGGFGITYLGFDTSLKKRVAIKEYYPRLVCSRVQGTRRVTGVASLSHPEDFQNGLEEFRKEAEILAQISSPNIVRVLNTFRENGTAYIIMEFADGISLSKEVTACGGRMPWQRVTDLFKDLIRELEKIHEQQLIHRDIKPDNLQIVKDVNGEERLVLLDFGTARHFESAEVSQTYTAMLTQGYAPLEQYSPKSRQGPYTDIYALCATMYAAITGIMPPGATERSLHDAVLGSIKDQGVKVPEQVEKAILHGLEVQREDRPQSMGELYAEMYGAEPDPGPDDPNELIYQTGMKLMAADTPEGYKKALVQFELIPGWKNAGDMAEICRKKIQGDARSIKTKESAETPNPKPRIWLIIPVLAVLAAAGFFFWRCTGSNPSHHAGSQTAIMETSTQSALEQEAFGQTQTAFYLLQKEAEETKTPQPVTGTPEPSLTDTAAQAYTGTPEPTATAIPATATEIPSEIPMPIIIPTDTQTPEPTVINTAVPTSTNTSAPTAKPRLTPTATMSASSSQSFNLDITQPTPTPIPGPTPKPKAPVQERPKGLYDTRNIGFLWAPSKYAESYTVEWHNNNGHQGTLTLSNSDPTCQDGRCIIYTTLPADGSYDWTVTAKNSAGSAKSGEMKFDIDSYLPTPSPYRPHGTVGTGYAAFEWQDVQHGVSYYQVQVVGNNNKIYLDRWFNVKDIYVGDDVCFMQTSLYLGPGSYSWRVRATNGSTTTGWSGWMDFKVYSSESSGSIPNNNVNTVPMPTYPVGTINNTTPNFQWREVTGAAYYMVKLVDSSGVVQFDLQVSSAGNCTGQVCTWTPGFKLPKNGNYTWMVSAYGENGALWNNATGTFVLQGAVHLAFWLNL